ncbi:MAG: TAT-variant-translocated molybdopterin oxidoreductase [Bacteroidetes bacterium]|nr:TAT-variant-translocated molybdopterin oxidoreductase [Bacteroidota bacterium]
MKSKKYWTQKEDLLDDPKFREQQQKEFAEDPFEAMLQDNGNSSRRDFLRVFGFTLGASAVLAACSKTPVKYALPYTNKPADVNPSVPNYYASTFYDGSEYSSVLVKVREGRPIFVETNPSSSVTGGGLSARGAASVLDLYDGFRLKAPVGAFKTWDDSLSGLSRTLKSISEKGGNIRIVTGTVLSPSTRQLIGEFADAYKGTRHVTYEAASASGILLAHEAEFGKRALPRYHFDKAQVIVGFNADFLGTWVSPVEFTKQYVTNRAPSKDNPKMSRHIQVESMMSLTGANADDRLPMKASMEGAHILELHDHIARKAGAAVFGGGKELPGNYLAKLATELWAAQGKSLVVSGSNDPQVQRLVVAINRMLQNYGQTLNINTPSYLRQGVDKEFQELVREMETGKVDAVFFYDCNPAYSYSLPVQFENALKKVPHSVAFVTAETETSRLCKAALPVNHWLESWGDAQPHAGHYSLIQPCISTLYDTRQFQDILLALVGREQNYYGYLQQYWKTTLFATQKEFASADKFWVKALERGVYEIGRPLAAEAAAEVVVAPVEEKVTPVAAADKAPDNSSLREVAATVAARYAGRGGDTDLYLYEKVGMGTGSQANIPWLQEMPDPITRATWDNYACVSYKIAKDLALETGDVVRIEGKGFNETLPVIVQPGVQAETVAVAVGYGRKVVGKAGMNIGKNAYPAGQVVADSFLGFATGVKISKVEGETYPLAITQTHGTVMDRPIIRETTLGNFLEYTKELQHERAVLKQHAVNLYPLHERAGHNWAMAIDLNKCTGCGACVVNCQSENNIPVVGKDEIRRGRELHWMRIDRYYSADANDPELAQENPEVVFQPMMCQHCDNAPCENVCPVLATVHSSEGLNQQAYNRCFGTRYCANNCPYKVRRFNWLDYTEPKNFVYNPVDNIGRMVLNPDVTVRARGVMEKCSFCVQRLQAGKLAAKADGRKLQDSDIQTACSKNCPAGAIVFGDVNDPDSAISKYYNDERTYFVLEELKVLPSVAYKVKVRNKVKEETAKA